LFVAEVLPSLEALTAPPFGTEGHLSAQIHEKRTQFAAIES
jgi:hypothetical protein